MMIASTELYIPMVVLETLIEFQARIVASERGK